jgi:diguanylate cyclase (GGDEF)-like protein
VLERANRIERLVFVDPHTGVYNRSYYDLQIRNEIARATREDSSLALLICDIDDFKSFNTSFGFEAGNQVLVQVAQTLRAGVRPFDTVARWGGEEFAVLLTPPVAQDDVLAISERLRASVERTPMRLEGLDGRAHRVHVTASVGVAMFPDHAGTPQDLWRAANAALLLAKRPPKNQVVFHRPKGEAKLNLH